MSPWFVILALLALASAIAAMTLRQLIHGVLCLALAFTSLAGLFLQLNAQFVGLARILVYVGAVAILVVFAVLLTGGGGLPSRANLFSPWWPLGLGVAGAVLAVMLFVLARSPSLHRPPPPAATLSVKTIGDHLMTSYLLPLEVLGLLLTAALIGAALVALREKGEDT
jgi:NADH:ubiquinone oxidoreductase subunit 6 (subunit J)